MLTANAGKNGSSLAVVAVGLLWGCTPTKLADGEFHPTVADLDTRTPVQITVEMAHLQLNQMRGHLATLGALTAALANDDQGAAGAAVEALAHDPLDQERYQQLGEVTPGFADLANAYTKAVADMSSAIATGDRSTLLTALTATIGTCNACHGTFRHQLVEDAEWLRLRTTPEITAN